MQAEQAIVNPGGTGTPRFVISARFAPLPPSVAFMSLEPSARPPPKKYTDFIWSRFERPFVARAPQGKFATLEISNRSRTSACRDPLGAPLGSRRRSKHGKSRAGPPGRRRAFRRA